MAADACNRRVVAGPVEATAIGNVMMQAVAGPSRRWPPGRATPRRAQMGPPHLEGDFLTGLRAAHQARQARPPLPGEGTTPTVGYPYYTIRGPRDFLQDSPMPIGY
jgi:hypothetical protein